MRAGPAEPVSDPTAFVFHPAAAAPGFAILVVSLGFNLLGDGLRDALDPKALER